MRRRCPCKGWIEPATPQPEDIESAVAHHVSTNRHRWWQVDGGLLQPSFEVRVMAGHETLAKHLDEQRPVGPARPTWRYRDGTRERVYQKGTA